MGTGKSAMAWRLAGLLAAAGVGFAGCKAMDWQRPGGDGGAGDTLLVETSQAGSGGVGVVRRLELLVAYTKSHRRESQIEGLIAARDEARAAGHADQVDRIEALGAEMQEIAHRQLGGEEPLYNVLLAVEDDLRQIMRERGLSRVLEAGNGVEGVDITDELVRAIEAGSGEAAPG